jgi:hypothetical protein
VCALQAEARLAAGDLEGATAAIATFLATAREPAILAQATAFIAEIEARRRAARAKRHYPTCEARFAVSRSIESAERSKLRT